MTTPYFGGVPEFVVVPLVPEFVVAELPALGMLPPLLVGVCGLMPLPVFIEPLVLLVALPDELFMELLIEPLLSLLAAP